jgi:hypothetical protein
MSETPETPTVRRSTAIAPDPVVDEPVRRTPRVFLGAAWVAIVAGIVFIVAVIFFTGYSLGRHSGHGGYHHGHHKHHGMMWHRQGQGGPGATTPANAPSVSPSPGPSQIPSSVSPSPTR